MTDEEKRKFIEQIQPKIKSRQLTENFYKILRVFLMISITICGFLTAASSQTTGKDTWITHPNSLLIMGLISAVFAILNQILSPTEKSIFHKNVKKALQKIEMAVEGDYITDLPKATKLRLIAITEPETVFKEILDPKL